MRLLTSVLVCVGSYHPYASIHVEMNLRVPYNIQLSSVEHHTFNLSLGGKHYAQR